MARLYRMDSSGHGTVAEWDRTSVHVGEEAFGQLQAKGMTIFAMNGPQARHRLKEFDPEVEEMLAVPRLQGG